MAAANRDGYDRIIVITDEQAHDTVPGTMWGRAPSPVRRPRCIGPRHRLHDQCRQLQERRRLRQVDEH